MADQRRSFSMGRGIRTASTQTTGRTKVLGMPNNGTTLGSVPNAGVRVPGRQLNPQAGQGESSIRETGRTKDYASAI